jgi:tetratricopeptide (TPR) repeat protein
MPPVPNEPTELDPDDLVEEAESVPDHKTTIRRDAKLKSTRPKRESQRPPAAAKPAGPGSAKAATPGFPDVDTLVTEARRRAEATGQHGDRIALARARTELAVVLEVVKGDTAGALAEYRAAHAIAPSALAPIAAARRLTPLRPIAPALALLEAELRATPEDRSRALRLLELGRLLLVGGAAPEKTVQAFRDLLAIDPDHAGGLRGLESALRALPRALENPNTLDALASHLEAMSSAWRADRRLSAWLEVERAALLEKLRRPDAARAALEGAMQLDGGLGPVRDAYTRHLILRQNANLLVGAWADEAALDGDTARAGRLLYSAARLASERLEQDPLAIDLHRRATALTAIPIGTRRAALRELSRLYEASGDAQSAIEAEIQLLLWVDEPERAYWHRRLAQALEVSGRLDDVATHARQALLAAPDDDDTRERLDRALAASGRHEERISLWTAEASRVATPSARVDALLRAAQIAEHDLLQPDLALVELRAAWAIDAEDVRVADHIARLLTPSAPPNLADPKDPSRARARIDFYAEAASKAGDAGRKVAQLEKLALIWEDEARDPRAALDIYREILSIEPERRSAMLGLQRNAARAGDIAEVFRALVMEADRTKSSALERGLLLRAAEIASMQLNDADTALDLVKRILAKNAGDPAALRAACRIHQRTGRYEEAVAQLRLLLQHTRKGPAAFAIAIDIAVLLELRLRRREDALAAYRDAFRIDPQSPLPAAEIRRILLATEDYRAVAEELVAMAANAASPEAKGRLFFEAAEIHADRLDDAERSVALLNQARALSPQDQDIRDRLERAYIRQNKVGDLVALYDATSEKTPKDDAAKPPVGERLALALLLAEDRDLVRASKLLTGILAEDKGNIPALRTLEHTLARTDQFAELAGVLRMQALMFETSEARLGAVAELMVLEEHRGVAPPAGAPPAAELLRSLAPEDILMHEAVLKRSLSSATGAQAALVTASLGVLAASTSDAHHAAALQLAAALLVERGALEHEHHLRHDALRRYRLVLDGWPECLTAARGMRRLAERVGDGGALIEAATALGNLESEPGKRAERLIEAADGLLQQKGDSARIADLFARALGEDPNSVRAATGLMSAAFEGSDAGHAVDALRRALDRTSQAEQAVRLGAGLARLAQERLHDPTVALEALRRVRKKAPGNVNSLLALADASVSLKLWADAAEIAQSAIGITRDPLERARAAVLLAEAHSQIADAKTNARREAEDAEKLADAVPGEARAELLGRIGAVYRKLDDAKGSSRVLLRAVVFGGKSERPLELLRQSYPVSTFEGATAFCQAIEEVAKQAVVLKVPLEPGWISAIGKIEATLLSKPREGIAKLKEAILLDPARIESYEALAEVYGALGAHEEAVKELLAILPKVATRGAPLDRMLLVFGLFARECKLARRTAQATTAEAIVAYLSGNAVGRPTPIPPAAPAPMSLAPAVLSTVLVSADSTRPWPEVAAALAEIMPKLLRADPFALGLSPRDRLPPRAPHPLRALADRLARAFGEPRFDLFVEAASVGVPRIIPSDPPAMVLPRGYGDLTENEQAAGIARLLVYLALNVPWIEELASDDLEGLLFGALRLGNESFGEGRLAAGPDANAEVWRPRIAKAAGRKQKRAMEEIVQRVDSFADPQAFRQSVRTAAARAAYLLSGDIVSTLNHLLRIDRDLSQAPRSEVPQKLLSHPMTRDLIFYALAPEALALRRTVGTG